MTEPVLWSSLEAARRVAAKQISAREYVQALLSHIDRIDPVVRAWTRLAPDRALEEAARRDEETARGFSHGPLHGVAVGLKDNFDTAGLETCAGSTMLAGNVPTRDAEVLHRLTGAGAILLGKTTMTPFAAMDPAATRNPWNTAHTPGGSSSGSAAAVGARMCSLALGSQTAGSVLRPAAYCGAVGLKPTYDAVSREGLIACAWSMDHVGTITRDVADAQAVFEILAGRPARAVDGDLTIGIPDRGFTASHAEAAAAFDAAIDVFRAAGVAVRPVELPKGFEDLVAAGVVVMYAELAAFHRDRLARRADEFPPRLRVLAEAGATISATDYISAQRVRRKEIAEFSAVLEGITALVTPTTASPPPAAQGTTGDWSFNLPFSASGHPAMTLPCGFTSSGLPLGLQAVAAPGREDRLFALGTLFRRETAWHARCPALVQTECR